MAYRDYMRDEERAWGKPLCVVLMVVIGVAFAFQQINSAYVHWRLERYLALSGEGLRHGYLWQLLTFQFLHVGLWHLLGNLLGLWFFGRYVEERLGRGRFLTVYFASGIAGGLLQTMLGWWFPLQHGAPVFGASAGVFGLLAAFAMLEPDNTILLFFVLPVRARYLMVASVAIALFFTIVPTDPGVAHAAHLGGLLTGAAFIRWPTLLRDLKWPWPRPAPQPRRRKAVKASAPAGSGGWQRAARLLPDNVPPGEFISREVDPILDKISAHGIHSLTARERQILEEARTRMDKR